MGAHRGQWFIAVALAAIGVCSCAKSEPGQSYSDVHGGNPRDAGANSGKVLGGGGRAGRGGSTDDDRQAAGSPGSTAGVTGKGGTGGAGSDSSGTGGSSSAGTAGADNGGSASDCDPSATSKDDCAAGNPQDPPADLWSAPAGATPATGSFVYLEGEAGDTIVGDRSYTYTSANAQIGLTASGNHLAVSVDGDEQWNGDFAVLSSSDTLAGGYYADLERYPFHDPLAGGLSWFGEGRGCNTVTGWFVVDLAEYDGATLTAIDLRFEQHCEGGTAALHGQIHWIADDGVAPPGPTTPPAGLWEPAAGATPATGNYVYLKGDAGDYIVGARTLIYTAANAALTVTASSGHLSVGVDGDETWNGDFQEMEGVSTLVPGYYGDLQRYPFHNPAKGGLDWSGEGRGCNEETGWFVIDSVSYDGGALSAIDLRFEQHCEGGTAALHGVVHWTADDSTVPPGPSTPPDGLWQPASGATPATGNYVYLKGDSGDYIVGAQTLTYTQANAQLAVTANSGHVGVSISGDQAWSGEFQAMSSLTALEPGYYGDLQRYPFHNPVKGGLSWSGEGRGCNTLTGWFVVDAVTYDAGALAAIDLRFEQHCEGGTAALHGKVHWSANDTTSPPGPTTAPEGLWQPAAGSTPVSGNYIYLKGDSGDFIVGSRSLTYTQADAALSVTASGGLLQVGVDGDQYWHGDFQTMSGVTQFLPGYYGGLQRYPFHNPVKGGLDWGGEGRGCNMLTGWFVVDAVTYVGSTLSAIDLRFEQHCEGGTPALHGKIHWSTGDATAPPGPVLPLPSGLWEPASGSTPASGNYVYLVGQSGDYILGANAYTYTDSQFTIGGNASHLTVTASGWSGDFEVMSSRDRFEPGYYGGLQRYPFNNPVKGGLSWSGMGRGCNTLTGWFVVDSVTYQTGNLTAIDLRFEQHCEGGTPAAHGEIHWSNSP